jgi:anti-anti-sigma factor
VHAVTALSVSSPSVASLRYETSPRVAHDGDRTVVWLDGEHDIATVLLLSDTLAKAIALDDVDVVVDLSEVEFIDAATIGVLLKGWSFLQGRSRTLTLRSPSRCAARIIDICGLNSLIEPVGSTIRIANT